MDFLKKLRALNIERCENYFKHTLGSWTLMEWGCAIAGEAGELCNILKKIRRREQGIAGSRIPLEMERVKMMHEMADVIIYCDLLAAREGIELAQAIAEKFNITSIEVGFNKKLTDRANDHEQIVHAWDDLIRLDEYLAGNERPTSADIVNEAIKRLARAEKIEAALRELVALKDIKDSDVEGCLSPTIVADYEGRKPLAWTAAREALS